MRLFLALRPPDAALDTLAAWQREHLTADVRVVPREHLHITLAFLGHRPPGRDPVPDHFVDLDSDWVNHRALCSCHRQQPIHQVGQPGDLVLPVLVAVHHRQMLSVMTPESGSALSTLVQLGDERGQSPLLSQVR